MKKTWCVISLLLLAATTAPGFAQDIDLLDKAGQGQWTSMSNRPMVFGQDGRDLGTVKYETGMVMEDGQRYDRVLFIHPPWQKDGFVVGVFPTMAAMSL